MNNQVKELFDYCYNAISSQKDAQGQDLINLEELDKSLSVLIMDCKDNPGKANEPGTKRY